LLVTIAVSVLSVISALVMFKVAKGVLKLLLLINAVLSIILAVGGVVMVKDALDLKNNFRITDNLLLFTNSAKTDLIGGMAMRGAEPQTGNLRVLEPAEVKALSAHFAKKDYAAMRGKNHKLILVSEGSVISSVPETAIATTKMSREEALKLLEQTYGNEEIVKARALLLSIAASENPLFILSEYKKGNIAVYPETPVFKAIKVIPLSLFKKAAEKILQQAAGVTKDVATKATATAAAAAAAAT
ncbi:MAG: hypothetical protein AABX69_05425, partial [Nanoarchaeota archaeon]